MGIKELKLKFVVDIAIDLFMQKSISEVTMKDIAAAADIGEATIYRYFPKKELIVLACVMSLQKEVADKYFMMDKGTNGYEKLKIFYDSYLEIFEDNPNYYYFIKEFDAFMYNQNPSMLKEYEKGIDTYKNAFMQAYEEGKKDGSVASIGDIDIFYFSSTHSLLELCKKLSINKALLTQDKIIQKNAEIQCLINIFLSILKNCESNTIKN